MVTTDQADLTRAEAEASDWFTRLKRTSVSSDELYAFRDWRKDPTNAAAFARVERAWKSAAKLRNDPELRALTEAALRENPLPKRQPRSRRWQLATPVMLAVGSVAATTSWVLWEGRGTHTTGVGEQQLVQLDDGSEVRLNTDSAIRVRFERGVRRVELTRGEAFFEVAHDAARPFVVVAGDTVVRALGTRFDVRRDNDAIHVVLVQGRVQVAQDGGRAAILAPSQQLSVTTEGVSPVRTADVTDAAGWTTGRLTFRDKALRDAIAEMNRYSDRKIVLEAPPEVAGEPVSGAFNVGDTKAFVTAVSLSFDLKAEWADGQVRLVGPGA